uniref:Fascin n=1 Tax=Octopus vulgaris TaxID=6645 RepID=A0A2I7NB53_OCTVU|nr:protein singed [Octopus vulgaris]
MSENGLNGHRNNLTSLQWKVGFINSEQKYLTAETFGHKINASGTGLKKRQAWTLEQDPKEEVVYIRSHLGRYLSSDRYGNITGECEEPGRSEKFSIEYNDKGQWAIKNVEHGCYVGGIDNNVIGHNKPPTSTEWWTLQLAIHPQVNLKNVNRKVYARLAAEEGEIQFTEVIPWGQDCLIILKFVEGKYALVTCDNRYLHRDGHLVEELSPETLFTIELKSGQISGLALKDVDGCYLTAVGHTAVMKARNRAITKDELFTIEDSHPQVTFTSHTGRIVSIKQGVDVSANQEEVTDRETFQLEFDKNSKKWAIRTVDNTYWAVASGTSGIQATSKDIKNNCLFDLAWQREGSITIKAFNNYYIYNKATGSLLANSDAISEKEKFRIRLVNRPVLVMKGEFGFVAFKVPGSAKAEYVCNKSVYDLIFLEATERGIYHFKGHNNKYWSIGEDGSLFADSTGPTPFILEFRGQSMFTVKAPDGSFLKGERNGIFKATGKEVNASTLWEF